MLNQRSWPPGSGGRQPHRKRFVPADSRARVVRRPPVPRAANDNRGGIRLPRLSRPLGTAIVAGAALLAVFALVY